MKLSLILLVLFSLSSHATLVGKDAPDFELPSHEGKNVKLSQFKGKFVVLEWLNHGCPFVKKHYGSGNMQKTQQQVIGDDTVWLSVISSAEGKQGHVTSEEAMLEKTTKGSNATAVLLDPSGKVGQMYGARTTPHMFIVSKEGKVVYEGAIDSISSADPADIPDATNHITTAMQELKQGKKVSTAKTDPYGCGVKYAY